jgi:hypothetical protein
MKRFVGTLVAAAVMLSIAQVAMAQSKTITGETKVITATVESIEASSRTLTLKKADGTYFTEIKLGDKVTARYYENMVIRLKQPGEKDVDTASAKVVASGQAAPGGTTSKQRTITATITEIDPKLPSITFTGPNGWKYSSRVEDRKALASVKVGDRVDIVWTDALLVSFDDIAKK